MQEVWGRLIDRQQLSDLSGGDAGFEAELLQVFIADTLDQLQALEQAIAGANWTQTLQIAHHIKGASANVGAIAIAAAAAEVETAGHRQQSKVILSALARLKQQVSELQSYLQANNRGLGHRP